MTRVIDLGNGYGRVEKYRSEYASLTFPLTLSQIRRLHAREIIDDQEAEQIFASMGYKPGHVKWLTALDSVTVRQWKGAVGRARTI